MKLTNVYSIILFILFVIEFVIAFPHPYALGLVIAIFITGLFDVKQYLDIDSAYTCVPISKTILKDEPMEKRKKYFLLSYYLGLCSGLSISFMPK